MRIAWEHVSAIAHPDCYRGDHPWVRPDQVPGDYWTPVEVDRDEAQGAQQLDGLRRLQAAGELIRNVRVITPASDPPEYRCICDPNDLFDPPDPRPRAVEGCPAHRARRAAQQHIERSIERENTFERLVNLSGAYDVALHRFAENPAEGAAAYISAAVLLHETLGEFLNGVRMGRSGDAT